MEQQVFLRMEMKRHTKRLRPRHVLQEILNVCERLHEVLATCYCAKANPKGLPLSLTRACLSGLDINICIYIYIFCEYIKIGEGLCETCRSYSARSGSSSQGAIFPYFSCVQLCSKDLLMAWRQEGYHSFFGKTFCRRHFDQSARFCHVLSLLLFNT